MRRGLKETIGVCSVATKQGCRPLPDEEGTESARSSSNCSRVSSVADRSPMRRGLKEEFARGSDYHSGRCRPLPDEEGTERTARNSAVWALLPSCRPLPDEEGTESLLFKFLHLLFFHVADRSPMRRGLKE